MWFLECFLLLFQNVRFWQMVKCCAWYRQFCILSVDLVPSTYFELHSLSSEKHSWPKLNPLSSSVSLATRVHLTNLSSSGRSFGIFRNSYDWNAWIKWAALREPFFGIFTRCDVVGTWSREYWGLIWHLANLITWISGNSDSLGRQIRARQEFAHRVTAPVINLELIYVQCLEWCGIEKVGFGLTGMAWKRESRFWPGCNDIKQK
jgi:hypothetical protein